MNPNIKAVVDICPRLSIKINVGNRHRIMNYDIRRGSLWIRPRRNDYFLLVTGDVEGFLYNFLKQNFGPHIGEDQGRKYWSIQNIGDVEKIIRFFGTQHE